MSGTLITTPFGATSTAAEVIAGVDLAGQRAVVTGASSGIGAGDRPRAGRRRRRGHARGARPRRRGEGGRRDRGAAATAVRVARSTSPTAPRSTGFVAALGRARCTSW